MQDRHIGIPLQGVLQHRNQHPVNLHGHHFPRVHAQILRHRADPRPDLQHQIVRRDAGRRHHLLRDARIHQKVLSVLLLPYELVALQYVPGHLGVGQIRPRYDSVRRFTQSQTTPSRSPWSARSLPPRKCPAAARSLPPHTRADPKNCALHSAAPESDTGNPSPARCV